MPKSIQVSFQFDKCFVIEWKSLSFVILVMTLVLLNIEILVLDHVWIIFFHRNFERVPPCSDREWGYSGPDQQAAGRGGELCQPVPHARTRGTITSCEDELKNNPTSKHSSKFYQRCWFCYNDLFKQ